jgi:hypothetical protein
LEMKHTLLDFTSPSLTSNAPSSALCASVYCCTPLWGFGRDSGGQSLITDICQSARSHGDCALTSDGIGGRGYKDQHKLLCLNCRRYYHPRLSEQQGTTTSTMEGTKLTLIVLQLTILGTRTTLGVK